MRAIRNLFWVSVQHSFNIPYGNFGIRTGWKIVSINETEEPSQEEIPDVIKLASLAIISKMMSEYDPPPDFHPLPPEELN